MHSKEMESLCLMEEKRQKELDSMIMTTKEKLEVSGAINSQALPSREMTPLTARHQHGARLCADTLATSGDESGRVLQVEMVSIGRL